MSQQDYGQKIALIALAIATPTSADQYFINLENGESPIDVAVPAPEAYGLIIQERDSFESMTTAQKKLVTMQCLLYGAFPEMMAEYNVQADVPVRQKENILPPFVMKILQGIHLLMQDQRIPRARSKMTTAARLNNLEMFNKYATSIQEMIASHFDEEVRPPANSISPLQRILDKIPATSSELLMVQMFDQHQKFFDENLAVIDLVQLQMGRNLTQINQFTNDPIQTDDIMSMFTLIIEHHGAVTEESVSRVADSVRLENDLPLFIQFQTSVRLFMSGELPGAIQPAKMHGLLGTTYHQRVLRSIVQLAINQLAKYDSVGLPITTAHESAATLEFNARNRVFGGASAGRSVPGQSKFLVPTPLQAKTDIHQQLSGNFGQDELSELLNVQSSGDTALFDLGPTSIRMLTFTVSLLIACCRVRLDAMQQTDLELMQEQDLYWLCVAKRMCTQLKNPLVQTELVNLAERTIAVGLIMNKDRLVKIKNKDPNLALSQQVTAKAEMLANEVLNTLGPVAEDNMFNQGAVQQTVVHMLYKALAQNNRIQRDVAKRQNRRSVQLSQFRSR